MDPGAPIFVPARSSAVEIRAPSVDSESAGGKSSSGTAASSISTSSSAPTVPSTTTQSKHPSNLRTSVSAPALEVTIPKDNYVVRPEQAPFPDPGYSNGVNGGNPYYYPGPEYAVYAPVPIGMDGQPQYGAFYPDAQYANAMSPYGEPNPYGGYGTVYYGHPPYGAPPPGPEPEMGYY